MPLEIPDTDAQDRAEVLDEDNLDSDPRRLARDDEELNFDDMPEVFDVTSARGDGEEDGDDALIGEELDDEDIVSLSLEADAEGENEDGEDGEDGVVRDPEEDEDEDEDFEDDDAEDEDAPLSYAGRLEGSLGAHSAAQRYESRRLSDADIAELGYGSPPKEARSFSADAEARSAKAGKDHAADENRLDEGLKDTFPASDPFSVKDVS